MTSGTPRLGTPALLTFSTSWAARAPTTAAMGHRSPALTLAKARTTSSSRGPCCASRLRASSSTRLASTCGQRGEGSPRQDGGGLGGLGKPRRGRMGTHWRPGPGKAALLPTESVQGLEGGMQAAAARQVLGTCHLDLGLCQSPAQGLLPAQRQGSGKCFPRAVARHSMAQRCHSPGGSTTRPRGDLRRSAPGAAEPVRPGPRSGRVRRSWCHRSPA